MKLIAPLSLILLGAPMAAMAGGMAAPVTEPPVTAPVPAAVAEQPVDWGGFYGGLSLGLGHSSGSVTGNGGDMGIAGVNLGYRYDMGKAIVGGELSYDKDNVGKSNSTTGSQINNTAALKLLVGTDIGRTLVYGTVGVAHADARLGGVSGSDTGYTAGIGADYALNQQWTLGGELAADRYNNFNGSGVDLKDTTLKVKVGFRF